VYSPDKPVLELDDHAWTLRAEPVAADEVELLDFERLLHVYHVTFDDQRKKVRCGCQACSWALLAIRRVPSNTTSHWALSVTSAVPRLLLQHQQPAGGDAEFRPASRARSTACDR
jgi:hypothetical protein